MKILTRKGVTLLDSNELTKYFNECLHFIIVPTLNRPLNKIIRLFIHSSDHGFNSLCWDSNIMYVDLLISDSFNLKLSQQQLNQVSRSADFAYSSCIFVYRTCPLASAVAATSNGTRSSGASMREERLDSLYPCINGFNSACCAWQVFCHVINYFLPL